MFKKVLSLAVCVLMLLGVVTTAAPVVSAVDGVSASYVAFTDGAGITITDLPLTAGTVKAQVTVSNSGTAAQNVMFLVGVYTDGVMVDAQNMQQSVAAGAANVPFSVTLNNVSKGTNTVLKAFVWGGTYNNYAVAHQATFPSSNRGLYTFTVNGNALPNFTQGTSSYDVKFPGNVIANPQIFVETKDNSTKVDIPNISVPGSVPVTVMSADGATDVYTLNLSYLSGNATITPNALAGTITIIKGGFENLAVMHNDRPGHILAHVSTGLKGADLIQTPLNDVRSAASSTGSDKDLFMKGNNTYFSFTADQAGTVYAILPGAASNYTSSGWTAVNNGTSIVTPVTYEGVSYSTVDRTLPLLLNPSNPAYYVSRIQFAAYPTATDLAGFPTSTVQGPNPYRYIYSKAFNAGDVVNVPTPGVSSPGGYSDNMIGAIKWAPPTTVASNNADLSSLKYTANGGAATAVSGFMSGTTTYNVSVPANTTTVSLSGTAVESHANIVVDKAALTTFPGSIKATVTAQDGTSTKTYTVNFTLGAPQSSNADLASLSYTPAGGATTTVPGFAANVTSYDVQLPVGTTGVSLSGMVADVGKATPNFGSALTTFPGYIEAVVTAENGTPKTYRVNFTVATAQSSNADLASLSYTPVGGTATAVPGFAANVISYNVQLPAGTTGVSLSGTVADVGKATPNFGSTLTTLPGSIAVVVTAQNGTPKTYTVNFTVATVASTNTELSAIKYTIGGTEYSVPNFTKDRTQYNISVPAGTTSVDIIPVAVDSGATILHKPAGSQTITNFAGTSQIQVTSADGSCKRTYIVTFSEQNAANPTFTVSDAMGAVGDEVDVKVTLSNNPGIMMFALGVNYDPTKVTATSVTVGTVPISTTVPSTLNVIPPPAPSPANAFAGHQTNISWMESVNNTNNGLVCTIKFRILPGATGEIPLELVHQNDLANLAGKSLSSNIVNGKITVGTPSPKSNNADLASLSYTPVGGTATAVSGFAANVTTYNVEVPAGTTGVSLSGIVADIGKASIEYSIPNNLTAFPGSLVATVTAEDEITTKTYTINFKEGAKSLFFDDFSKYAIGATPIQGTDFNTVGGNPKVVKDPSNSDPLDTNKSLRMGFETNGYPSVHKVVPVNSPIVYSGKVMLNSGTYWKVSTDATATTGVVTTEHYLEMRNATNGVAANRQTMMRISTTSINNGRNKTTEASLYKEAPGVTSGEWVYYNAAIVPGGWDGKTICYITVYGPGVPGGEVTLMSNDFDLNRMWFEAPGTPPVPDQTKPAANINMVFNNSSNKSSLVGVGNPISTMESDAANYIDYLSISVPKATTVDGPSSTVAADGTVTLNFNNDVFGLATDTITVTANGGGTAVVKGVTFDANTRKTATLTFDPGVLAGNTTYTVSFNQTKVLDVAGQGVAATATFTTETVASNNADLASLSYTPAGGTETAVSGFAANDTEYDVALPEGTTGVSLTGVVADTGKALIGYSTPNELTAFPGSLVATVTAENDTTKTYTVNFTVAVTPKVTSLTINSNHPRLATMNTVMAANGIDGIFVATKYLGSNKYSATELAPVDNLAPVYSDRPAHTFIHVNDNLKGTTQILCPIADSTRTAGTAMSEFLFSNKEYFNFKANSKGTVYVISTANIGSNADTINYKNNYGAGSGWTTIANGVYPAAEPEATANNNDYRFVPWARPSSASAPYFIAKGQWNTAKSPDPIATARTTGTNGQVSNPAKATQPNPLSTDDDILYYNKYPHAYGKAFEANTTVSIPVVGNYSNNENIIVLIKWGESTLPKSSNKDLNSLSYTPVGGTATPVAGYSNTTSSYDIVLPAGTTGISAVTGIVTDTGKSSVLCNPLSLSALPGNIVATVTAEDNSTRTITLNFTVAASGETLTTLSSATLSPDNGKTGIAKVITNAGYPSSPLIDRQSTNYGGSSAELRYNSKGAPGSSTSWVYAKFDLSELTGTVKDAVLKIKMKPNQIGAIIKNEAGVADTAKPSYMMVNISGITVAQETLWKTGTGNADDASSRPAGFVTNTTDPLGPITWVTAPDYKYTAGPPASTSSTSTRIGTIAADYSSTDVVEYSLDLTDYIAKHVADGATTATIRISFPQNIYGSSSGSAATEPQFTVSKGADAPKLNVTTYSGATLASSNTGLAYMASGTAGNETVGGIFTAFNPTATTEQTFDLTTAQLGSGFRFVAAASDVKSTVGIMGDTETAGIAGKTVTAADFTGKDLAFNIVITAPSGAVKTYPIKLHITD